MALIWLIRNIDVFWYWCILMCVLIYVMTCILHRDTDAHRCIDNTVLIILMCIAKSWWEMMYTYGCHQYAMKSNMNWIMLPCVVVCTDANRSGVVCVLMYEPTWIYWCVFIKRNNYECVSWSCKKRICTYALDWIIVDSLSLFFIEMFAQCARCHGKEKQSARESRVAILRYIANTHEHFHDCVCQTSKCCWI